MIAVLISVNSGTKHFHQKVAEIRKEFLSHSTEPLFMLVRNGDAMRAQTRKVLSQGYQTIVAAGGDGTIHAVASELVGMQAALGIIPIGTFNHLAHDLGIPASIPEAVQTVLAGKSTHIDAAEVNGKFFVNNANIGLYPKIIRHREEQTKLGRKKWLALAWATLTALRRYNLFRLRLHAAERDVVLRTPFVFVGNNEYDLQGTNLTARPKLNAGKLSVYIVRDASAYKLLPMVLALLLGRIKSHANMDTFTTTALTIESKRRFLKVALDGELEVLATPLHYKILPGALRVIAPKLID